MKANKAVILAGGLGTRFLPASKAVAKELFPVYNKPVLQYLVEELTEAGIEEVLIVLGKDKDYIINHFEKNEKLEARLKKDGQFNILKGIEELNNLAKISYVKNVAPLGAGYALSKAKEFVGDDAFVLLVGDEIGEYDEENTIQQMLKVFNKENKNILGVDEVPKKAVPNYGMIEGNNLSSKVVEVTNMIEKPAYEKVTSNLVTVGKYIFKPNLFEHMENLAKGDDRALSFNAIIPHYINEADLLAVKLDYKRFDTGNKLGFVKANINFALKDEEIKNDLLNYLKELVK